MVITMFKKSIFLFLSIISLLSSPLFSQEKADLILYNGKVITVDSQDNIYEAIAVKDDKIIAVGTNAEILALQDAVCNIIDLEGRTLTPGLTDSHYHMMYYGQQFWPGFLNIRYPVAADKASLLQVVGDYTQQLQENEWVSGNQGFTLRSGETINRYDLDAVTPENPVYLRHSGGQYSVVNSLALEIADITDTTDNPPGSLILRDENGNPTGILSHYPAENLVGRHATGYGDRTDEQKLDDIELGQELCFEAGYTSIQDVIVGSVRDILLYKQFAEEGRLKARVYSLLYVDSEEDIDVAIPLLQDVNRGRFTFNGWKLAMDGGLSAQTTLFYDRTLFASRIAYPYHSQDAMNSLVQKLHDTGLQVAVHVAGDEGIDMTLTAFENAMRLNPRPDPRHRIEHGLFPTEASLQRFKDGNIILSTQPQWITWYGDGYIEVTDAATMEKFLPLKTMYDMGINLAFGCDVPASHYQEPKWAFYGATYRRTPSGNLLTQDERLSMPEVLRLHTMGSAYAGFAENESGSLEVGKFADMVVWSHDLYTMPINEFINLEAEMTIVGGEIVFNRGNITSVEFENLRENIVPPEFSLSQNYPNPFNPKTKINFTLAKPGFTSLIVYNNIGEKVANLVSSFLNAGSYRYNFDATGLTSGVYFYRLISGKFTTTKKMMVLE